MQNKNRELMEKVSTLQLQALGLIRKRGYCSRREIGEFFHLGPASISKLLKPLIEQGILLEESFLAPGNSRIQAFLKLDPNLVYALGVDIGFSFVSVGLVDLGGTIVERLELIPIDRLSPEKLLRVICEKLGDLRKKHREKWISGTGISFAGVALNHDRATRKFPNTLPWDDVPIRHLVQKEGGENVEVRNDTIAGLMAELRYGKALHCRDVIYLNMVEGISVGLLASNQVVLGYHRDSGEFGHICVIPDGPYCHCGGSGCLESVASSWAILKQVKELMANGVNTGLEAVAIEELSLEKISQVALEGGSFARNILTKAGRMIGGLLAMVTNVMDPEKVILGGILSLENIHPTLIENIKISLQEGLYVSRPGPIQIESSAFGLDSSLIGAGALVFEKLIPSHPQWI